MPAHYNGVVAGLLLNPQQPFLEGENLVLDKGGGAGPQLYLLVIGREWGGVEGRAEKVQIFLPNHMGFLKGSNTSNC